MHPALPSETGVTACSVIKQTLQHIVEKQYNLSDVFGELIDEVLRAESEDNED
jgi:hypothetical protein